MMKFIVNAFNVIKKVFYKNKSYLVLQSVKKSEKTIFCEFNELLRLDGNLIKFNIEEVANNINIQESISSKTLFLIGVIYGKHQNSLREFRAKIIDVKNGEVVLENANEKITVSIKDLMNDDELIKQINSLDLIKIVSPYMYRLGYNTCASLDDDSSESCQRQTNSANIVNLF